MCINLLLLGQVNTHPCLDTRPTHDLCVQCCSCRRPLPGGAVTERMVILEHVGHCLHAVGSDGIIIQLYTFWCTELEQRFSSSKLCFKLSRPEVMPGHPEWEEWLCRVPEAELFKCLVLSNEAGVRARE